jgi:hypothetical protein
MNENDFLHPRLVFIKWERLKEHEGTEPIRLNRLLKKIMVEGFLRKPIAVDLNTFIILDGHHRFHCLKQLGCEIIPTYLFDYRRAEIVVFGYRKGEKITKEDVIRAGLGGNKLPSRSSKHMIRLGYNNLVHISYLEKDINIPLEKVKSMTASNLFAMPPYYRRETGGFRRADSPIGYS